MTHRYYPSDDEIDDLAQVDGDVAFQPGGAGQPWLRTGVPPWHMWGSSQVVRCEATGSDQATVFNAGQLAKVAYKRPETWHFLFQARIINAPGPVTSPTNGLVITVRFDVITGIGRSQSQLVGFDTWNWIWTGSELPPTTVLWATSAETPLLRYVIDPDSGLYVPDPRGVRVVDQIIGQDIQVTCAVSLEMTGIDEGDARTADVEVSAYVSPKTHIRPEWFLQGTVPEVNFGGDEIKGT